MSANDILDVLNVQRDSSAPPPKKKKKTNEQPSARQTGMARELYNLIGPNTPPIHMAGQTGSVTKDKFNSKPTPWSRVEFSPISDESRRPKVKFNHWQRGSKELIEQESQGRPYIFEKFNVRLDLPDFLDEEGFHTMMKELDSEEMTGGAEKVKGEVDEKVPENSITEEKKRNQKQAHTRSEGENTPEKDKEAASGDRDETSDADKEKSTSKPDETTNADKVSENDNNEEGEKEKDTRWSYEETRQLFELCKAFDLKWPVIYDRFLSNFHRSVEDLKKQYYRVSAKIIESQPNHNASLVASLRSYSRSKEIERKHYLEGLLKRTPAEIAEEESLVIEARRFELGAKKMLLERSHLLSLLDSPQTSQSVQQYQSSQGLTTLYNNLMIMDKHQKKKQLQNLQKSSAGQDPIPPSIPVAASSSFKRERTFHTPLQQHLATILKSSPSSPVKQEPNAIQQLLMKRLTVKEEEAYGLFYHANEKLTPGVVLRSTQKIPALQQRSSVLKALNNVLSELDIPKGGGNSWRPIMPTRKTMAKYDELLRSVVTLMDVKRGKDRLESEIRLIKSQRDLQ